MGRAGAAGDGPDGGAPLPPAASHRHVLRPDQAPVHHELTSTGDHYKLIIQPSHTSTWPHRDSTKYFPPQSENNYLESLGRLVQDYKKPLEESNPPILPDNKVC